jgi:hypothetical protein
MAFAACGSFIDHPFVTSGARTPSNKSMGALQPA